jgi:hypothetical protein
VAHDVLTRPPAVANPTLELHRRAVLFFGAVLLFALWGFWPSYFAPPKPVTEPRIHLHGMLMFGWVLLLIAQAGLIRAENRALHRRLGLLSYVLMPAILVSTASVLHWRLNQRIFPELLYFVYVILAMAALFAFSYAMAMVNRKRPALHARYMVCSAASLLDPILARILYNTAGIEPPLMQLLSFGAMDAFLAWLAYKDWKAGNGIRVFPVMLGVFIAVQIPTFFLFRMPWWPDFARWLASLPMI